jgi:hypothetical protein
MKLLFELANELLPLAPVFMDGFLDHELEDFRAFINWTELAAEKQESMGAGLGSIECFGGVR